MSGLLGAPPAGRGGQPDVDPYVHALFTVQPTPCSVCTAWQLAVASNPGGQPPTHSHPYCLIHCDLTPQREWDGSTGPTVNARTVGRGDPSAGDTRAAGPRG